jgi:hypothetical protein
MYGGKHISKGDVVFVFASENEGGPGLIASGMVTARSRAPESRARSANTSREHHRQAYRAREAPPGRAGLKPFSNWSDGRPETELNFKFYRHGDGQDRRHLRRRPLHSYAVFF